MAKINAFHNGCLRKICRIFWPNKISNEDGLQQCCPRNQTPTTEMARTRPENAQRQHPQNGTEKDTTWKKEARMAKDDMATDSNGRAEREGAVTGKTAYHDDSVTQAISEIPSESTYSPTYEQTFVIEYEARKADDEQLVLQFVDKGSRDVLVTYNLPVSLLRPFHQYHLDMNMPDHKSAANIHTYVTLMRRTAVLPNDFSSPNFLAFQVFLQGFERRLKNPVGRLLAVARIVPDYYSYKWVDTRESNTLNDNLIRNGGLDLKSVMFPSPSPSVFQVPDSNTQGHAQVTLAGGPPSQPEWNHSFLFTEKRDKATLFTPSAALVIEYFQETKAQNDMSWRLRNIVGFSALLLNENIYKQMESSDAKMGIQVQRLPVQGTGLKTFHDRYPTVGLILRLISSERPDKLALPSQSRPLPTLQYTQHPEVDRSKKTTPSQKPPTRPLPAPEPPPRQAPPTPRQQQPPVTYKQQPRAEMEEDGYWLKQRVLKKYYPVQDDNGLPSHNAMENILPEYKYIFVDPDPKQHAPGRLITNASKLPDDLDKTSLQLLDHQMRELEKYRAAVHKMGEDILTLRQQIRDLEAYNSQLRRDLSQYNDATKLLLDSQELDGLTKPELAARYVALKQKLTRQTGELQDYKDRVQVLQNDLIKHNDQERDFLRMSQAHVSQNEILHKLQNKAQKVKKLEEACKKQEKVIEKLERLLSHKSSKDTTQTNNDLRAEALMDENKRLRGELEDVREQTHLLSLGQGLKVEDDEEKLLLYEKLERYDSRVTSLERELSENARKWGREKSELMNKLQEAELGFRRISPISKPRMQPTTYSYDTAMRQKPRRYSKAPTPQSKLINSTRDPFSY
ncbi:hypothetical protein LSH36_843g00070 [Paralvinella palmiformis]|uniref:Coiled-coil domain-containing protein 33 n=1 Tax=Paralvinella palmiformis TaxID=53620 RepID=A0AAD9IZV6_9ANNE|nr:hypothetical protein LSH36_843g00070 [Paralvinella palmiformis]